MDVTSQSSTAQTPSHSDTEEVLRPAVAMYGPCSVRDVKEGDKRLWCRCGLSKTQPWCDGSHVGTGFTPMSWTVSGQQTVHQLCACKYTETPPHCDGTHTNLPADVLRRQRLCASVHPLAHPPAHTDSAYPPADVDSAHPPVHTDSAHLPVHTDSAYPPADMDSEKLHAATPVPRLCTRCGWLPDF